MGEVGGRHSLGGEPGGRRVEPFLPRAELNGGVLTKTEAITNETTELVCFSLQGSNGLDRVADKGADPDAAAALPKGSFLAYNCDSGGSLAGRLF